MGVGREGEGELETLVSFLPSLPSVSSATLTNLNPRILRVILNPLHLPVSQTIRPFDSDLLSHAASSQSSLEESRRARSGLELDLRR